MNVISFIILILFSSACSAQALDCVKITHEVTQAICVTHNYQVYAKEIERLEARIMLSKDIPEKDKQLFLREQAYWSRYTEINCDKEVYCLNAETERRVNDLTSYLASFNKNK